MYPTDVRYTRSHEWARVEGNVVTVGITSYAAEELSDIVYVELPSEGTNVEKGSACATLESVKAVSDVYAPVTGQISEVNHKLEEQPELINNDTYGEGWIAKIVLDKQEELTDLMDSEKYAQLVEEERGQ